MMIVYDLKCLCGCQFEGWFEGRRDFDRQHGAGLIGCPQCGGNEIRRILSPVAFHAKASSPRSCVSDAHQNPDIPLGSTLEFLRAVQDVVEKNFEDVGSGLAEEALKIYYGVNSPRNIRGVTTAEEEKMLAAEGIELLKFPVVKKTAGQKLN